MLTPKDRNSLFAAVLVAIYSIVYRLSVNPTCSDSRARCQTEIPRHGAGSGDFRASAAVYLMPASAPIDLTVS